MDIDGIRRQLPVVERWIYLDHAGVSPLPTPVMDAVDASLRSRARHGKAELGSTYRSALARCRSAAARLLGASAADIALVGNTTEGLNVVAQGFPWREGDNVVTADVEYPSNVHPWLNLRRRGVEVRLVHARDGWLDAQDIEGALDGRTRMLALSHVEFISGQVNDLACLGAVCRARQVRLVVDAAQSLGAVPIDARALGIDALASCGWKWLLGPLGTGILYCAPGFLDQLSLTFAGPDSMACGDLLEYRFEPRPDAARFEYSTHDHASFQGFAAALEWLERLGPGVHERVRDNAAHLDRELRRLGFEVLGNPGEARSGIVSFRDGRVPAEELAKRLQDDGVYGCERCGYVRFSPHFYNTEAEIEAALASAAKALH